jgi:hypothetical protein
MYTSIEPYLSFTRMAGFAPLWWFPSPRHSGVGRGIERGRRKDPAPTRDHHAMDCQCAKMPMVLCTCRVYTFSNYPFTSVGSVQLQSEQRAELDMNAMQHRRNMAEHKRS